MHGAEMHQDQIRPDFGQLFQDRRGSDAQPNLAARQHFCSGS